MRNIKEKRGITLIALAVTIIVLLILAAITISVILSDNGIINKAKEAADAMNNDMQTEYDKLNNLLDDLYGDENIEGYIPLEINFLLDTFNTTLGEFPVVFEITANIEGKKIYHNMVSANINKAGNNAIEVNNVGPEGSEVTISVVYSGANYNIINNQVITTTLSFNKPVEIKATYNGGLVYSTYAKN